MLYSKIVYIGNYKIIICSFIFNNNKHVYILKLMNIYLSIYLSIYLYKNDKTR